MPTAVVREYNPTTGKFIGVVSELSFGHIPVGNSSVVRVVDLSVDGVDSISNVRLQITASDFIGVNDSPTGIAADGSSSNGNFGIEHDTMFVPRSTLTRFFPGLNMPVSVGSRSDKVSQYTYLNIRMNSSKVGSGAVSYQWIFDVS
jgi:hypothetical protein